MLNKLSNMFKHMKVYTKNWLHLTVGTVLRYGRADDEIPFLQKRQQDVIDNQQAHMLL